MKTVHRIGQDGLLKVKLFPDVLGQINRLFDETDVAFKPA
jgi:hypothetical protein